MRAPALYALIFFVVGILVGCREWLPGMGYLGLAVVATAAAVIYATVNRTLLSRAALCVALIGAAAFVTNLQLREFPVNHISHFTTLTGRSTIVGRITDEPDIRPTKTFLTVEVESLARRGIVVPVSGQVRVRVSVPTSEFNIGDRVRFSGFISAPAGARNPGAFDYRRYLEQRQISAICNVSTAERVELVRTDGGGFVRNLIGPTRRYIVEVFDEALTPDQSALMRGFLIGDVRMIPKEVYQRFKDTGTLHVLAASGSNVGYVTLTIFLAARIFRIPRRSRYIIAISGVVVFSFLAYNQPSVLRASIMAVVALIGLTLRRDQNWLNTICVAGLIVLAIHPLYLFDLGTQLSFAAAFALILFMPALEPFTPHGKTLVAKGARYFLLLFYGSVVAQLGVMPILLYHFHTVPLVSFLANLLIVPLVGLAASLGIVLVFVSAIPVVVGLCGQLLGLTLDFVTWAIVFFERLHIPPIQIGAPEFLTIVTYYLFLQVILTLKMRSTHFLMFVLLFVAALNAVVWKAVLAGPEEGARVTLLDTSALTTVFVKEPDGQTILINGGGASDAYDNGEGVVLPFLRFRGIGRISEMVYTTEREGNLRSLKTVAEALSSGGTPANLRSSDPVVRLDFDSLTILLLTEVVAVQNLNIPAGRIAVLCMDWGYLGSDLGESAIRLFHPETIVFTNYTSRYARTDQLALWRAKYPQTRLLAVLEAGAIELAVTKGQVSVWTTANN